MHVCVMCALMRQWAAWRDDAAILQEGLMQPLCAVMMDGAVVTAVLDDLSSAITSSSCAHVAASACKIKAQIDFFRCN